MANHNNGVTIKPWAEQKSFLRTIRSKVGPTAHTKLMHSEITSLYLEQKEFETSPYSFCIDILLKKKKGSISFTVTTYVAVAQEVERRVVN